MCWIDSPRLMRSGISPGPSPEPTEVKVSVGPTRFSKAFVRYPRRIPPCRRFQFGTLLGFWANYNDLFRRLVTLNGGESKGIPPKNPLNSGLGIILICPVGFYLSMNCQMCVWFNVKMRPTTGFLIRILNWKNETETWHYLKRLMIKGCWRVIQWWWRVMQWWWRVMQWWSFFSCIYCMFDCQHPILIYLGSICTRYTDCSLQQSHEKPSFPHPRLFLSQVSTNGELVNMALAVSIDNPCSGGKILTNSWSVLIPIVSVHPSVIRS